MTGWTLEVTNTSQVPASQVTLDAQARGSALGATARLAQSACGPAPPAGCVLGTLAPGERRTVDVRITPANAGTLTLAATVRAAETEARTDNNADSSAIRILEGLTTLSLAVSVGKNPAPAGEHVPVTVTVRNTGRRPALGFNVCKRLPPGLGVAQRGGARLRNGRLCWRISRLAPRARRTLRVMARVSCVRGRRTVVATVRGGNVRARTARLRLRIACAPQVPRYTG